MFVFADGEVGAVVVAPAAPARAFVVWAAPLPALVVAVVLGVPVIDVLFPLAAPAAEGVAETVAPAPVEAGVAPSEVTLESGTSVPFTTRVGAPVALSLTSLTVPLTEELCTDAVTVWPRRPAACVACVELCSPSIALTMELMASICDRLAVCDRIAWGLIGFVGSWFCSSATRSYKKS